MTDAEYFQQLLSDRTVSQQILGTYNKSYSLGVGKDKDGLCLILHVEGEDSPFSREITYLERTVRILVMGNCGPITLTTEDSCKDS